MVSGSKQAPVMCVIVMQTRGQGAETAFNGREWQEQTVICILCSWPVSKPSPKSTVVRPSCAGRRVEGGEEGGDTVCTTNHPLNCLIPYRGFGIFFSAHLEGIKDFLNFSLSCKDFQLKPVVFGVERNIDAISFNLYEGKKERLRLNKELPTTGHFILQHLPSFREAEEEGTTVLRAKKWTYVRLGQKDILRMPLQIPFGKDGIVHKIITYTFHYMRNTEERWKKASLLLFQQQQKLDCIFFCFSINLSKSWGY